MFKIYDREHNQVKQGEEITIAGFEYDLLTQDEADNTDFGYFKDYNDPMLIEEEREVVWTSRDGEQEIVVGYIERIHGEEDTDDDE